jgi:hypothetical protein
MPTKQTTYKLSIREILRAIETHYKIPAGDIWKIEKNCTEIRCGDFDDQYVALTSFTMGLRKPGRKKGHKAKGRK